MVEKFYTILTAIGKAKLANSAILGSKINFKTLKVGDGKGDYYELSENQTAVVNKVWEGNINSITIDKNNSNWIVTETIIPSTEGGFFVREAGIYDEDGDMIAVSKLSETYKPIVSEGSTKDLAIRIVLEVGNVDSVNLKIDPTVILATKKEIQVLESKLQEINTQLSEKAKQSDLNITNTNVTNNTTNIAQLSNPNLLINGDFQIWQRGENFTAQNKYTADRWYTANGYNNIKVDRVLDGGEYVFKLNDVSSAGGNSIIQHIENYSKLNGKVVTMSACVKSDDTFLALGVFGTTVSKTVTPNQYSIITHTFTIPSNNTNDQVKIVPQKINGNLYIKWVKLELGSIATPFVQRLYGEELTLCKRYYRVLTSGELIGQYYSMDACRINANFEEMRITPSPIFPQSGSAVVDAIGVGDRTGGRCESRLYSPKAICFDILGVGTTELFRQMLCGFNVPLDAEIY